MCHRSWSEAWPLPAKRSRAQPRNRGTVVFQATALAVATTNTVISRTSVIASEFDHVLSRQVKMRFRTMKRSKVIFMNVIKIAECKVFRGYNVYYIYILVYIYICEQNDPCSGCYSTRFQNTLRFAFTSVSMACNGSAIDFPRVGALEPNIAFGGQSLEIQREAWILYPRIVPICTPHVRYYMNLPNTKDGNLLILR